MASILTVLPLELMLTAELSTDSVCGETWALERLGEGRVARALGGKPLLEMVRARPARVRRALRGGKPLGEEAESDTAIVAKRPECE